MSSIIRYGETYHGISVFGRGVFANDGHTFAGQHRDGHACGLGMATWPDWYKTYAEHGRNGKFDGRCLRRYDDGDTDYYLFERGEPKDFDTRVCQRHLHVQRRGLRAGRPALACADSARRAGRGAPRSPSPRRPPLARHSPPSDRPMDRPARFAPAGAGGRRGHRGASQRTPSLVVARHNPTAATLQSTSAQRRVHATDLP
jgi:hypothetical protein